MSELVSRVYTPPASEYLRTGQAPSSTRVSTKVQQSINHLTGSLLGGLRHSQVAMAPATDTSDTARVYTYRHPNCDFVDVVIGIDTAPTQTNWSIAATAGGGSSVSATSGYLLPGESLVRLRCPWDSADSGDKVVSVAWANIVIRRMYMWDVPRETLTTGDSHIAFADATYRRIGLGAEYYMADSATAGVKGMIQEVINAWTYYQPQVMSWWTESSNPTVINASSAGGSGAASDVFGGTTLRHQCRQKRDSDTAQTTRWYIRSYCAAGTTYSLKVSTGSGGSGTKTGLVNTSAAWQNITSVSMSAGTDDTFIVEAWRTAGAGNISIEAVSGIEDP